MVQTIHPKKKKPVKKGSENSKKKILVSSVVALSFLAIVYYVIKSNYGGYAKEAVISTRFAVKGVDLSHHNPILNWNVALGQNISFTYLKATEGTTLEDINYRFNYEGAKRNNIKVGAYHFYSFGVSGKDQADHFIAVAKLQTGDLVPAIDIEHSPSNPYSRDSAYVALVVQELKMLEDGLYNYYGVHPIIYTNRDCYKLYVKNRFPDNPIWMCDLTKEPRDVKNWIIWQYSNKGAIGGVNENIDLNYFRYSFQELNKYLLP